MNVDVGNLSDGTNAIQILLLVGGITLVPALLFTVTGFTRIIIVLGFIRSGLGTPTAPPNQHAATPIPPRCFRTRSYRVTKSEDTEPSISLRSFR